ncbi:MAG: Arm DNA-binding domain-containing protein, partial [Gammaproteobacteria bacterium]|nr:Arm DNA-binding domain-containing protein [Gammaproteobacteria bacterium]
MKYRFAQKEKLYSIGVYPYVSLKQARLERDEMRAKLRQGIDPSAAKQSEKLARIHAGENSFKAISIEWFKVKLGDKSKSYRDRS